MSGPPHIAYEVIGEGAPIVLVHGFASSRVRNWKETRWFETLTRAGRQVIAVDCRGHGDSDKPHDPAAYTLQTMAGDVIRVMDERGIGCADVMGYSMGGRIALGLLVQHAARVRCAVLAGIGSGALATRAGAEIIAQALESPDAARGNPTAQAFRAFAVQGHNDLAALAACMRGLRYAFDTGELHAITAPVLIVAGGNDTLIGDPRRVAALIPHARVEIIPGRDHMSTVGDRRYKAAALAFLAGLDAPPRAG